MRAAFILIAAFLLVGAIDGHRRVTRERGELAAASITGNSLGTAVTVLTTTKDTVALFADTDCSVGFMLTKDGADFKRIFPGKGYVMDLNTNGLAIAPGTYKVYYTGSAPSSCTFELFALPFR